LSTGSWILSTISTALRGPATPIPVATILITPLGLLVLALGPTTTTTTIPIITSIPVTSLGLGSWASGSYARPKPRLGLLQPKHRPGGLDEDLHLELVLGHSQPI
jgi:hypothetical protein